MPVEGGAAQGAYTPIGAVSIGRGSDDENGGSKQAIRKLPAGRLAGSYAFYGLMGAVLFFVLIDKICPRSLYLIAPIVVASPVITQMHWLEFLKVLFERATVLDTEVVKHLLQGHVFYTIDGDGHCYHILPLFSCSCLIVIIPHDL